MKRAILMIIDGLRADMANKEYMPALASLCGHGRRYHKHRAAFPTATRINSATLATGCLPFRHGLHGNAIALDEGDGLRPVSVGEVDFTKRWRKVTGRTLHVPTLSEHLHRHGGVVTYSNSSPGAAHMQDPDGFGTLYHRSGSHGPGLQPLAPEFGRDVSYDAEGDRVTTARFCASLRDWGMNGPALQTLWICEPDHSQHALELGSPEHRAVLAQADNCVATVAQELKNFDEQTLVVIASDHGHETVHGIVPVVDRLIDAGLKESADSTEIVIVSSGMSALVYASEAGLDRIASIRNWLAAQSWVDRVFADAELQSAGLPDPGLYQPGNVPALAFAMAKIDEPNRYGIRGLGYVAADSLVKSDRVGWGQHGGLGPYESNPLLCIWGGGFDAGVDDRQTHAADIAPTILAHLGVETLRLDGRPLQSGKS